MKRLTKYLLYFLLILFSIYVLFLLYAMLFPLPLNNQQIIIYDKNNHIIYQNDKSNTLKIEDMNPFLIDAIVDIEDKRFFSHMGFDVIRMGQAAFTNIKNKDVLEGGSTITQQYAKNMYLTNTQTLERKVKEFFYALRLEMNYSKEEILEGYINSMYYGHGVYGLKNASSFYFGKDVNALSISQTALLIGIPNGPSFYSPYASMEQATEKRNQILKMLKEDQLINEKEYENAVREKIILFEEDYSKTTNKSYYINSVLEEVSSLDYEDDILHVYTYYDAEAQDTLTSAIKKQMKDKKMQSSGIIMEPYTSNILAIQGGNDFNESNYNRALLSKRQVASTIKPLLYYLALTQGFTPSSTFSSEPTSFTLEDGSTYSPGNYNDQYPYKDISMLHAISMSDNIYAVKTHLFLGMDSLTNALKAFGIKAEANPSLALGTVNLSIYDITSIYNTFASEGLYNKPSFISEIKSEEKQLFEKEEKPKQLLDRNETLILNQALTATYDTKNISKYYPTMVGKQTKAKTAVKSGTSDWDTWVIGFNPYYSVGIWNGYDDNREIKKEEYNISKDIWQDCFDQLMEKKKEIWYEKSDNIIEKKVNPITGLDDVNGSLYWYLD